MRTTPKPARALTLAGLLLALPLALPCAARAATSGTIPTGTTGVTGSIAAGGPPQTWTVQLAAGQDYALAGATPNEYQASITVEIDAAGGQPLCSAGADFAVEGCSFRAPYSGLYTVAVSLYNTDTQADYWLYVNADCRADPATRCHLAVNHTHAMLFEYDGDHDWVAVRLEAGRRYRVAAQAASILSMDLALRAPNGAVLVSAPTGNAPALTYRAPRGGTYYVEAVNQAEDFALRYTLALTLAR